MRWPLETDGLKTTDDKNLEEKYSKMKLQDNSNQDEPSSNKDQAVPIKDLQVVMETDQTKRLMTKSKTVVSGSSVCHETDEYKTTDDRQGKINKNKIAKTNSNKETNQLAMSGSSDCHETDEYKTSDDQEQEKKNCFQNEIVKTIDNKTGQVTIKDLQVAMETDGLND
ncbi:hypothetical protein TNCT_630011 [Trichonephila clavata]|uniref:Uncharacterized protein n=1 Tax=Trichonephila clavata TaxID=2740835 RepID=A0A8X6FWE9_TRICU|nr:hypothetical protein TNCT_630011 [Trichonephila clavata]